MGRCVLEENSISKGVDVQYSQRKQLRVSHSMGTGGGPSEERGNLHWDRSGYKGLCTTNRHLMLMAIHLGL